MSRKVFISFLGGNLYEPCAYRFNDGFTSQKVRFIQEATLLHLTDTERWEQNDIAYILLTEGAKQKNWEDDGHKDKNGNTISTEGLKTRLSKSNIPMRVEPIDGIPECMNENEIMSLFSRVFGLLNDEDTLYLDITHGFRFLPMLILVLSSYSRFLKNTRINSITYGNFESKKGECAPVTDLLPLASLLDWTFAAGQFAKGGNMEELIRLSNDELLPILKESKGKDLGAKQLRYFIKLLQDFINERQFCRGKSIIQSKVFSKLKLEYDNLGKSDTLIPPLMPVLNHIGGTFEGLDTEENIKNGYLAAKWCYDNGLYQQSITILQENMITEICMEAGIDWQSEVYRSFISAMKTKASKPDESVRLPDVPEKEEIFNNMYNSESWKKLQKDYQRLSGYRNNINHSEMNRDGNFKVDDFKKVIADVLQNCVNRDSQDKQ